MYELKGLRKKAKKTGNSDALLQIRELLGEEKQIQQKVKKHTEQTELIGQLKTDNRDRATKGLEPVYQKKRDIKNIEFKKQFDKLESTGRLDKFMERKTEEMDKKKRL